jgi:hypothetical protein
VFNRCRRETLRHDFIAQNGLDQLVGYEPEESRTLSVNSARSPARPFATEPTAVARNCPRGWGSLRYFTVTTFDEAAADFAMRWQRQRVVNCPSRMPFVTQQYGVRAIICASFRRWTPNGFAPRGEIANGAPPVILCVARRRGQEPRLAA